MVLKNNLNEAYQKSISKILKNGKKPNPKLIYPDVCALCRPFDDQSYLRIRMETEAVNLI